MTDPHLSIGEVLALLQDDFPDVTISKIRFLESQGLISPERTPSGYRKFYAPDIERLRWILLQQKENFLPLKVIRERLEAGGSTNDIDGSHPDGNSAEPRRGAPSAPTPADDEAEKVPAPTVRTSMVAGEIDPPRVQTEDPPTATPQPIWMADLAASRGERTVEAATAAPLDGSGADAEVSLTSDELIEAAGIGQDALRDLEQFGLLSGRSFGDTIYYDADALVIARRSAALMAHGIDARHLRMFKVAADREAGFLEQVAMPMLKKRNPEARRQAVELLEELSELGHDLRAALLRGVLRDHLRRS